MLEKKNQGNLIAGNPGETKGEGQTLILRNFQFTLWLIILKCYRYPQTVLLEAELAQGGVKLVRNL